MTIKRKGNRTEEEGGRCRAAERHETFDCVPAPGRVQGADDEEGGGEQVYVCSHQDGGGGGGRHVARVEQVGWEGW
jgi:hypothetical protein